MLHVQSHGLLAAKPVDGGYGYVIRVLACQMRPFGTDVRSVGAAGIRTCGVLNLNDTSSQARRSGLEFPSTFNALTECGHDGPPRHRLRHRSLLWRPAVRTCQGRGSVPEPLVQRNHEYVDFLPERFNIGHHRLWRLGFGKRVYGRWTTWRCMVDFVTRPDTYIRATSLVSPGPGFARPHTVVAEMRLYAPRERAQGFRTSRRRVVRRVGIRANTMFCETLGD